ncbi:hypothetical protein [Mesorhizobium sp. M1D.F.Ca.ET.043.01.1.1]|uniref:hypothetical protein n=1 Tax=Mesorhizobium sp. M1D.F.Ca.ET.043.01.1.1 TaxID=2493669 RepID=UPI000F75613D|nr:hypothetical protein [Mesorhizobium sp. M1D.F.Ca.ET.043.01.1.1]AZO71246.1 hypothetical protein EJ067_08615 [Mesorhizobium sp. M1D.F.Ca.ET.043.01.1.1]
MMIMLPTDVAADPALVSDAAVIAERNRYVAILQRRARSFEHRKLLNLSRALTAVAEEIDGRAVGR